MLSLQLPHHRIEFRPEDQIVVVTFLDGSFTHACPHDTDEYRRGAAEKSAGCPECVDTMRYCFQHDLLHCFVGEIVHGGPSPTLWAVAHGLPQNTPEISHDESVVADLQRLFMMRGDHEMKLLTGDSLIGAEPKVSVLASLLGAAAEKH